MREIFDPSNLENNYGLTAPKDQVPEPTPAYLEMCEHDPEMSDIAFSCEWILIMMNKITADNALMLQLLGSHFEKLCFFPPRKVFEYLGAEVDALSPLLFVRKIDTLHSIMQYAPHLNGHYDTEAVKALLHFRISKILMKTASLLEKMASDDESAFSKESLSQLESDLTALKEMKAVDICRCLDISDDDSFKRIQTSFHDLENNFLHLESWARDLGDANRIGDTSVARLFRNNLTSPNTLDLLKHAAHIYGEVFAPSAPSPHQTVGIFSSAIKSCSRMAEDENMIIGTDVEIILATKGDVKNGHTVLANRTRFIEVIKNLFRNSIDSKKAGEKCSFKVIVSDVPERPGYTMVRVVDNGVGLDISVLDRLFEEEVSVIPDGAASEKQFGGQGVGLLGSAVFLRDMGGEFGEVKAHSSEAGYDGAEFCFYLKNGLE